MGITKKAKNAYLDRTRRWPTFTIEYDDLSRRRFAKHLTWDEAEKKLSEIKNRIELGSFDLADYTGERVRSEEIGRAAIEYIAERERSVQLRSKSARTLEKDSGTLLLFIEFTGKKKLIAQITKDDIDSFALWLRDEKKTQYGACYSDSSIRSYMKALSPFFTWSVEKGFAATNPVCGFAKRIGGVGKDQDARYATSEEVNRLREAFAGEPDWQLESFNFAVWSSARASEVLNVKKTDVFLVKKKDHDTMVIRLTGKGGKTRSVPVGRDCAAFVNKRLHWLETGEGLRAAQSRAAHPKDAAIYQRRWEQGFLFHDVAHRSSLAAATRAARRKAGIDRKITFHSARHTYATDRLGKGVSLAAIRDSMGHAEIRTTEGYAKLLENALIEAMEGVEEI